MANDLRDKIIEMLQQENPGLLPDEAGWEADAILYRKDTYEQAKWNLLKEKENER